MAIGKDRFISDAIGTFRDYWRIGKTGVRLKNVAGVLEVKNAADTLDAPVKVSSIQIATAIAPAIGDVWAATDTLGNAAWSNPSILPGADNFYPTTCSVPAEELLYTVGTRTVSIVTTSPYNFAVFTTTDLAASHYFVDLQKGTWDFKFWALKRSDCGRVAVSIGLTILSNPLDLYAAVTDTLFVQSYTGITIATSGRYQFSLTTQGKNPSSSSFVIVPIRFWGLRTGA